MDLSSPSSAGKQVFDEIRRIWVKATPEEIVRQQWLRHMVGYLHYPRELLVVEKQLKSLPHCALLAVPDRRLDILCYGKSGSLFPLVLVECKEGALTEDALNQVIGYNHYVRARFVAVVNATEARFGVLEATNNYLFFSFLPAFKELVQWVKQ